MRGGEPDPKQVEAIIRFARGLPMVVDACRAANGSNIGVEDFQIGEGRKCNARSCQSDFDGRRACVVNSTRRWKRRLVVRWFDTAGLYARS